MLALRGYVDPTGRQQKDIETAQICWADLKKRKEKKEENDASDA